MARTFPRASSVLAAGLLLNQVGALRILFVEQDPRLATIVRDTADWRSYTVDAVRDVAAIRTLVRSDRYDAVVLALTRGENLRLSRTLRADGSTTPIVILDAQGTFVEVIAGLNAGADDYLTGHVDLAELSARLRALARRHRLNHRGAGQTCACAGQR